jgi:signal transduction histidine kinase/ActR/RegA family two-component response regulator
MFQGDASDKYNGDYGTPNPKELYGGAENVFANGEPVLVMNYSNNAESSYSFMPVKNDDGDVIAVIGTYIDMQSLANQLRAFMFISVSVTLLITCLILSVMYIALRFFIIRPIGKLTAISGEIANGNVYNEVPGWIKSRTDEMGILGKSYESMSFALQEMLSSNNNLFKAAMSGRLDTRGDPAPFKGFFSKVINRINDTLDVIGIYFGSIPCSLAILNAEHNIVFTNSHFKRMFSSMADVEIFRKMLDANEDEDHESLKQKLAGHLSLGEYSRLAWIEYGGDKRCLSFLCHGVAPDGKNNGAIIAVVDNTELALAKDRALSANKAKSEFLSRISHELRTPLNVILSMSKLGLNDVGLAESKNRFQKIVTSSSHLSNIINDVLEMSRMESGKTEIKLKAMRLTTVVNECVDLLTLKADEKNISLISTIETGIPDMLFGDEFRIRQILINLLSNAVKFTDEGRVSLDVTVAERDGGNVSLSFLVSDTGIGISDDFLAKIFLPFEQEDSFLSRRYQGSGLGLSISHNLASLMGGTITAASAPGEGSRFELIIPFVVAGEGEIFESAPEEDTITDYAFAGKRILLADDIDINRLIIKEIFSGSELVIDEASDGDETLRKYRLSPVGYYNCILLDIQMPKLNGYETAKAIRGCVTRPDRDIPIIAMTANALKEDVDLALASGMNDHIAKPVDFDDCRKKVAKYSRTR